MHLPAHVSLVAGAAVALLLAAGITDAASAATTVAPSVPVDARVSAVSHTSFAVRLPAVHGATSYRLLASTLKSDLYIANYRHPSSHRRSSTAKHPTLSLAKLPYTAGPYWYRVVAVRGSSLRWAVGFASVGLRPATPTGVTVKRSAYLTWSAGAATGARIEQADDAAFTSGRHTWSIRGGTHVVTPVGLTPGHRYWFRVRSINSGTVSAASGAVRFTPATAQRTLRVMTYNLLSSAYDGTSEGGQKVAPWSSRRLGAAKLIEQGAPAVVAVQEGWGLISAAHRPAAQPCTQDPASYHYRNRYDVVHEYVQVDALCDALGGRYRRADNSTDTSAGSEHGTLHAGLGNYLLYDPRVLSPVAGASGFWNLGDGALHAANDRTAAFTVFTVRATGARVLITSAHPVAQAGTGYDRIRARQTARLISQARAVAGGQHVTSIVHAGDFNAYPGRHDATDTPGAAMHGIGAVDALQNARSVQHSAYNSANQYLRTPPEHGGCVDHVYVSPGIGIRSWNQLLNLSRGRFVGTMPSDHNPVYVDLALPV